MQMGTIDIDVPPPLSIKAAADIKQLILTALRENTSVKLRLPKDAAADLSFIQLIESARLYAEQNNKQLSLIGPVAQQILDLLAAAGFGTETNEFWLGYGE